MNEDDKDRVIGELFDHAYFMHGYLVGALMAGGKTGTQAWEETRPMRRNVCRLARLVGQPIPTHFADADVGADGQ